MKRLLFVKEKSTFRTIRPLKAVYQRSFSRRPAACLILLACCLVFNGNWLYGQDGDDALFINDQGNVGIGTNQLHSDAKLTVEGKIHAQGLETSGLIDADKFIGDGSNLQVKDIGVLKDALDSKLDKAGGKIDDSLLISGKVGIGIPDPKEKLHVNGTVMAGKVYSNNAREEKAFDNKISTSSKTFVDMPDMNISVKTGKRYLLILFVVSESWANGHGYYRLLLDDDPIGSARNHYVSRHSSVMILRMTKVSEGQHNIRVQWKLDAGKIQSLSTRTLAVIEM
jgi:hypothetical protein